MNVKQGASKIASLLEKNMTNPIPELTKDFLGINNTISTELADDNPQSLRQAIQLLIDIEAIRRLKHAYFRCLDTANVAELSELLHEDVVIEFFGGTYEWSLTGKKAFVEAIGAAFNSSSVAQHTGHHPEIEVLSENEATGVWHLSDQMWLLEDKIKTSGSAFYYDRYHKHNGQWLIRESRYHRLFEINEGFESLPLSAHYLAQYGQPQNKK